MDGNNTKSEDQMLKKEIIMEEQNIKRMNRQKYIYENLKVIGVMMLLLFLNIIFGSVFGFVLIIGAVAATGYGLYLNACRMHDIGFSGLWQLPIMMFNCVFIFGLKIVLLSQAINLIMSIILFFIKGTEGPNKFGEDPLMAPPKYVYDNDM